MGNLVKMSVYDALERRKIYNKKLEAYLSDARSNFLPKICDSITPSSTKNFSADSEKANETLKANFDSIVSLLHNISEIDAAISEYNASTTVTIGDKDYSIAAAISKEKRMDDEINFLTKLLKQYTDTKVMVQEKNEKLNSPDAFAEFLKKTAPEKTKEPSADLVTTLADRYKEMYTYVFLDPNDASTVIPKMIAEAETFKAQFHSKIILSNYSTELELNLA